MKIIKKITLPCMFVNICVLLSGLKLYVQEKEKFIKIKLIGHVVIFFFDYALL